MAHPASSLLAFRICGATVYPYGTRVENTAYLHRNHGSAHHQKNEKGVSMQQRWFFGICIALLLGLGSSPQHPNTALAQLVDEATNSAQGAQFLGQPKPPHPPTISKPSPPKLPTKPKVALPTKKVPKPPAKRPLRAPVVLFLLDASSSMATTDAGEKTSRIVQAQQAIAHALQNMPANSLVQLYAFNNRLRAIKPKGGAQSGFVSLRQAGVREGFIQRLERVKPYGTTHLYRAVIQALTQFNTPKLGQLVKTGQRFAVLLLISDGKDAGKTQQTLAHVQQAKQHAAHVVLYAIGFKALQHAPWFKQVCAIATSARHCKVAKGQAALGQLLQRLQRYANQP